jgi:CRP-like cAMP-binding protein
LELLVISENAMDVLRTTSLFAGFNEEQLEMVPKVGRQRRFETGDKIVEEGATGAQSLWLILEGEVDVVVGGEAHRTLGPGTHFGELALLTDAPRSADVVARTDTLALEFSRRHLDGLIAANPQVAIDMLAELATRLRRATEALAEMVAAQQAGHDTADPHHLGAIEYAMQRFNLD